MANQIDAVKQLQKEIENLIGSLKSADDEIISISKNVREGAEGFTKFKTPKDVQKKLDEIRKSTELLNAETKEKERIEKQLTSTIAKKNIALEASNKAIIKERFELQQVNKLTKEAVVLSSQNATLLQKASVLRNQLSRKIQDLNVKKALGNKLSKEEVEVLRTSEIAFKKYDKAVKSANKSVGRFQENVGNYPKGLKAAIGAISRLTSVLGFAGAAFLAIDVSKDAFKRIKDFDKTMQNLSGVLRVNRKDVKDLEKEIISVAGSSVRTSNEIAKLATSLITLGKSKDEVKGLLQPVTDLSLGLNVAADEAGEFLVQMLNSFGAGTDEAEHYADVIATIRTSTSLDFQKMRDSFAYLAPIAKVLGKDLAFVGSVVGILADNGIKAESSGRLLASSYQKLAAEGRTLEGALNEINEAQANGIKENELLAIATNIFGKESAKIGIILANNTDVIEANAQAIRDNGGALDKLVSENMKSLEDKIKVLDSSWEELILTIDDGTGSFSGFFKGVVDLTRRAVNGVTELIKAQKELNKLGVEESVWRRFFNGVIPGLSLLESGYEKATAAQKKFNKVNEQVSKLDTEIIKASKAKLIIAINSGKLSEAETKTYVNQIRVLEGFIKIKRDERKELVATAKELGYAGEFYDVNKEKLFNYYKTADEAGSRSLKIFIENEKAKLKASSDSTGGGQPKEGRSKAIELSKLLTKTSNDLAETEIRNAFEITEAQIKQYATVNKLKKKAGESDRDFEKRVEDEIRASREVTNEYKAQFISLQKLRKLANEPFDENGEILDPDKIQAEVDTIVGDLKRIEEARKQLVADAVFKEALVDLADTFDEFTDISGAKLLRFFDSLDTNGAASLEELGEIASASFSLIADVSDSFFQGRIDGYDADIEKSNAFYDNLLANEENSAELNKRLQKDKKAAEDKLLADQAKERKKQFLANKAFAIAEVAINTAISVSKAAGQTGIFGLVSAIPLIALGALQTGLILAQPTPKFAEGGTMTHDGAMMINDHSSGRLEVVERDGKLLMTNERNAIVEGKKGDIIHKDAGAYFNNLSDNDVLSDAKNHSMIATLNHQNNVTSKLNSKKATDAQKIHTDRIVKAVLSKRTQFNVHNNVSLSDDLRYLNASNEF